MYKIICYVTEEGLEPVKNAMFEAGAGRIAPYTHCSWQVLGEDQFMATTDGKESGDVEKVPEYKIEMVCDDQFIHAAISAMKKAHPYEVPGYHVVRCEDL
jgi:structural hemagglutinin/hemolysin toxin protein RtxA